MPDFDQTTSDPAHQRELIAALGEVRQPWSAKFTEAILALVPVIAVEAVILRPAASGLEVLLIQRSADDIHWPNALAVPGTVVRGTDQPTTGQLFDIPLRRLEQGEIGVPFKIARFIGLHHFGQDGAMGVGRANTFQAIHVCELSGVPARGEWYPVVALPGMFLPTQRHLIDKAVAAFRDVVLLAGVLGTNIMGALGESLLGAPIAN